MKTRRSFQRPSGERPYRKLFVLATEGRRTEPEYFSIFNDDDCTVHIECIRSGSKSSPAQVLKRMARRLEEKGLKKTDEAWLVVDTDKWTDLQLFHLHSWSLEKENRGLAVSNPGFEYWLLLHFDEGARIDGMQCCLDRLRQHLPDYDKSIGIRSFPRELIEKAVERAKKRDAPPCEDWPRNPGATTVYRLVANILKAMGRDACP